MPVLNALLLAWALAPLAALLAALGYACWARQSR
jgi:hypothetical protein